MTSNEDPLESKFDALRRMPVPPIELQSGLQGHAYNWPSPTVSRRSRLGVGILTGGLIVGLGVLLSTLSSLRGSTLTNRPNDAPPEWQTIEVAASSFVVPLEPHAEPRAVTIDTSGVWVATASNRSNEGTEGALVHINGSSEEIDQFVPIDVVVPWESGGGGLAIGFGHIWVGGQGTNQGSPAQLQAVDPQTGSVDLTKTFPGEFIADVATSSTDVWIALFDASNGASLLRLDPASGSKLDRIELNMEYVRRVSITTDNVIVVQGLAWPEEFGGPVTTATSVDMTTGLVLGSLSSEAQAAIGSIEVTSDAVWGVANNGLLGLDPRTLSPNGEEIQDGSITCCLFGADNSSVWTLGADGDLNRIDPTIFLISHSHVDSSDALAIDGSEDRAAIALRSGLLVVGLGE